MCVMIPLIVLCAWLTVFSALERHVLKKINNHWQVLSLGSLFAILLSIFCIWLVFSIRYHRESWLIWRRRNCQPEIGLGVSDGSDASSTRQCVNSGTGAQGEVSSYEVGPQCFACTTSVRSSTSSDHNPSPTIASLRGHHQQQSRRLSQQQLITSGSPLFHHTCDGKRRGVVSETCKKNKKQRLKDNNTHRHSINLPVEQQDQDHSVIIDSPLQFTTLSTSTLIQSSSPETSRPSSSHHPIAFTQIVNETTTFPLSNSRRTTPPINVVDNTSAPPPSNSTLLSGSYRG